MPLSPNLPTSRQRAIDYYRAVLRAGYAPKAAAQVAYNLLTKAHIQAAIAVAVTDKDGEPPVSRRHRAAHFSRFSWGVGVVTG